MAKEHQPEPYLPFPLDDATAADHPKAPQRVSKSGRRYCPFCNRPLHTGQERVCPDHRTEWNKLRARARKHIDADETRRNQLGAALRKLARLAKTAATAQDNNRRNRDAEVELDATVERVRTLRAEQRRADGNHPAAAGGPIGNAK